MANEGLINRWDSSDPDRAPPPLPPHPGVNSPKTKSNASPTIQAAAAALSQKSHESITGPYTTNPPPPSSSPEKSLVKGQYHRRPHSLQPLTNSRELTNYFERRSPEKPLRVSTFDVENKSPEKSPPRKDSPRLGARDGSTLRPSSRYLSKPILGENTPPSATMLALQNMQVPPDLDLPHSLPSSFKPPPKEPEPESLAALYSQMKSLTAIATGLQQELNSLSRRSKDNATDLVSLKAATNTRDEDIRKSLRELSANLNTKYHELEFAKSASFLHPGSFMLDNKIHDGAPLQRKSYSIPNIGTSSSLSAPLEHDLTTSPGPISTDGSASIALLEKVLREMATKEGQETLISLVEEVKSRPGEEPADKSMGKMLEEILSLVKDSAISGALVRTQKEESREPEENNGSQSRDLALGNGRAETVQSSVVPSNEDIVNLIKRVNQSVAAGGGLTNEVKALVRELRGEVLGMGRDIARKLDEAGASNQIDYPTPKALHYDEIANIVQSGLNALGSHMEKIINESHQKSVEATESRHLANSDEIYKTVQQALSEIPPPERPPPELVGSGLEKREILDTVREAWESYRPEIELQNFGLEREEILECLTEGLKNYQVPRDENEPGATYEQVVEAISQALEHWTPPRIEPEPPSITKEEITDTIRGCLEGFEWPAPVVNQQESTVNKDDVIEAVREGFAGQDNSSKEIEVNRDDIIDAVRDALETHAGALNNTELGERVLDQFHILADELRTDLKGRIGGDPDSTTKELNVNPGQSDKLMGQFYTLVEELKAEVKQYVDGSNGRSQRSSGDTDEQIVGQFQLLVDEMKEGFQQYSAANGKDTEQVLDTVKDGLEALRTQIETYVDRAVDGTGKDEIIDVVKDGVHLIQCDLERVAEAASARDPPPSNTVEILDAMEKEFEHLRQSMSSLLIRNSVPNDKEEILDAIRDISDTQNSNNNSSEDVVKIVKTELEHLRETITMTILQPNNGIEKDEIMVALKEGFNNLQEEHTRRRDGNESIVSNTGELLDAFQDGIDVLRADMEKIMNKSSEPHLDSEILESLRHSLAAIRSEIEQLKDSRSQSSHSDDHQSARGHEVVLAGDESLNTNIESIKFGVTQLQDKVENIPIYSAGSQDKAETVKREDISELFDAIKTVQNMVLEIGPSQEVSPDTTQEERFHKILDTVNEVKNVVLDSGLSREAGPDATKEERFHEILDAVNEAKNLVLANGPSLGGDPEGAKKEHLDEVLEIVKEVQGIVMELATREDQQAEDSSKKDTTALETLLRDMKSQIDGLVSPEGILNTSPGEKLAVLEGTAKETKAFIEGFAAQVDAESTKKADLSNVEGIVKEIWLAVEDLKTNSTPTDEEKTQKIVKNDIQSLETLLFEIKTQVDELKIPDPAVLPAKDDLDNLCGLVTEFKEKMESEADMTAQAFEARKVEHGGLAEKIEDAKALVNTVKDELREKLGGNEAGLSELKTMLLSLTDSAESFTTADTIKELSELVTREFERSHSNDEAAKIESQEREASFVTKQDETRASIVVDVGAKVDEKLGEVLTKYEDTQLFLDSKFGGVEERDSRQSETLNSTKALAEELKQAVDGVRESIKEAYEKLEQESQTLFGRVDHSISKMDDMHGDVQAQGDLLKEEFARAAGTNDRLDAHLTTSHPELANTTKEILALVGQHYDHSRFVTDEIKANVLSVPSAITPLLPAPEKYDDSKLHDKLNTLLEHAMTTSKSLPHMDQMDQIQEQVVTTAREVREMMEAHSSMIATEQINKRKESEEAAIALEQRLAEKKMVESEVSALNEEKAALQSSVRALNQEREDLSKNNKKLVKEVSGLETALRIRREEMHLMEERAEGLERRVVEGVLDHARSLLINKPAPPQAMSLKRVPSTSSTLTRGSSANKDTSALSSGVGMALKRRPPTRSYANATSSAGRERRILSLNNVNNSRGSERQSLPAVTNTTLSNLKRSQSAKTGSIRKTSWDSSRFSSVANKENEIVDEESEHSGNESDATERRASHTGTRESMPYADQNPDLTHTADRDIWSDHGDHIEGEREDGNNAEDLDHDHVKPHIPGNDSGLGTDLASTADDA